jgi:uncharacterized membrane protein YbhN (UPF0104 family)
VSGVLEAFESFFDGLTSIEWRPLALAILCHLAKTVVRARAWRNVLAAAYPEATVRWRSAWGAYVAGAGVNAVLPARAGDVVRLYLMRRSLEGSTYATLASSLLVEALFDAVAAVLLLLWVLQLGVLPGLDVLPSLPALDWLWLFENPTLAATVGAVLVVCGFVLGLWAARKVEAFWHRVAQGLAVLRTPRRYVRTVVPWQVLDWGLRLATIAFFLDAFGLSPTLHNALLVQATESLSTALPLTPGGIGTEQALVVYVFRGDEPASAVLSFSVGMKAVLLAVNALVGGVALAVMLRTLHLRRAVDQVSATSSAQDAAQP